MAPGGSSPTRALRRGLFQRPSRARHQTVIEEVSWNPDQYLRFDTARRRPAVDLLERITMPVVARAADLGCGAGNVTRLLAARWPGAQIIGIDRDPAMLARAAAEPSAIRWLCADVADWRAEEPLDLIFSNAALHWLPDHQRLLPTLVEQLAPGGTLAIQMPANFDEPAHRILRDLAGEPRWREVWSGDLMGRVLTPAEYHRLLAGKCGHVDLWETNYWHLLHGEHPVLEWMSGSTLVPYLERLDGVAANEFLAVYADRLRAAYPCSAQGTTLFPFRRIFLVGRR